MGFYTNFFELETKKEREIINITEKIKKFRSEYGVQEGRIDIFTRHTTLGFRINEDEELLRKDIAWFMNEIIPKEKRYFHDMIKLRKNCPEDEPKNARGHLMNLFLNTSESIPIYGGKLLLGEYQEIFAIETSGPRTREIVTQIYDSKK